MDAGARSLIRQRYVQLLFLIASLGNVVGMYVEYRFYATAAAYGNANAGFFADYQLALSSAALL